MSGTPLSTERLWELLSSRLRSFLQGRVADPQVAEDLLQETFLRIHTGLDALVDDQRLEAWVFRIARNLLIDRQRARGSTPEDELDVEVPSTLEAQENLNELVGGWLPEMIGQLPEPYGEAVRLYELEGLSQQAIAKRLGLSLSGAKSRIQRGRDKLKQALLDCCTLERDRRGNVIDYRPNRPEPCDDC